MNRTTWFLLAALVASLAWAFWMGQRKPTLPTQGLETVWKVPPEDVRKIEFRSGDTHVVLTVTPRKDGPGDYIWLEGEGLKAAPAPRRPRGNRAQQPPPEPEQDAFQGGPQAHRLIEELANLQAVRRLGAAKDLKVSDFGLGPDDKAFLAIERGGGTQLRLSLGTDTVGNGLRYGLSSADNQIYLVRNAALRNLANVRRLMDRELFAFPIPEAQRIEIELGGRKLTMHKLNLAPAERNRWARTPDAKAGDPALQQVVNGLLRIKVLRYLPPNVALEKSVPWMTVSMFRGDAAPSTLRLFPVGKDDAPAISTHTERPVGLNVNLVNALRDQVRAALKP